ncbi:hypothetical protein TNCV_299301 [Trichonephila clavipes]|nr:hypothetical protein TNCV_299301 [Trichonephila clavipes]
MPNGIPKTLDRLHKAIKNKCPGMLSSGVLILHDNTRSHVAKGIDSTICTVRKYKDLNPSQVSPPGQHFANANPDFPETVQGFDQITSFHQENDIEETLF